MFCRRENLLLFLIVLLLNLHFHSFKYVIYAELSFQTHNSPPRRLGNPKSNGVFLLKEKEMVCQRITHLYFHNYATIMRSESDVQMLGVQPRTVRTGLLILDGSSEHAAHLCTESVTWSVIIHRRNRSNWVFISYGFTPGKHILSFHPIWLPCQWYVTEMSM